MTETRKWKDPFEGLNPAQREVVAWDKGVLRVCAVAGSGKTRSMVNRIARMVRDGIDPTGILAVTFTKKAADEMEERLKELGCPVARKGGNGARVGTFHSLGLEIIRDGSPWEKFIVDNSEMIRILKHRITGYCMENGVQIAMNWRDVDLTEVMQWIDHCQNELIPPEDSKHHYDRRFDEAYHRWEEERTDRGILTFGSMIYLSNQYLAEDESACARWEVKYRHVMIDEYQDTNLAQKVLIDLLSRRAESFMIVGDDDQSIYEWRGAKPKFMIEFHQEHPAVHSVTLDINYRSVPEVITAGNAVIQFNQARIEKQADSNRGTEGNPVVVEPVQDMDAEAEHTLDHIRELMVDGRVFRDFTIMYRTNAQSRAFEEVFLREEIPYEVVGGQDFYKRKEIADVLAYLRIIAGQDTPKVKNARAKNQKEKEYEWPQCRRAVNTPFRFIGKASIAKLEAKANEAGIGMFDACDQFADQIGLQRRQINSLRGFVAAVRKARSMDMRTEAPLSDVISTLLHDIEYISWIERDQGSDTSENSRVSNVRELIRTANRFQNAALFLHYIAKMEAEKRKKVNGEKVGNLVQLMSVHRSKGLEFPVVFLAGACEDILPHARSENIEEERRLFYVALTRARDRLFILVPRSAWIGSKLKPLQPSRFIAEAGLLSGGPSADTSEVI